MNNPTSDNRKAYFDYTIGDKYEAGIALYGWEVKSARAGNVNLKDSFIDFKTIFNGRPQAFLKNAHISTYEYGNVAEQEVRRPRRLLLNRSEINKIAHAVMAKGYTCVATKLYFKGGRIKLEIALARGKHNYDKKQAEKERAMEREARELVLP